MSFTAFLYCTSIYPSRLMLNQGSESCFSSCLNIPIPKFDWFGELLVERVSGQMVMRGISSRPVNHRHPCTTLAHAVRSLHASQICLFSYRRISRRSPPLKMHFSHGCFFILRYSSFSFLLWLIWLLRAPAFFFPSFLLVLVMPREVPVRVNLGSSLATTEGVSQFSLR